MNLTLIVVFHVFLLLKLGKVGVSRPEEVGERMIGTSMDFPPLVPFLDAFGGSISQLLDAPSIFNMCLY